MKGQLFWVLFLEGLVGLHRTIQFQLRQPYWSVHRLELTVILNGLPWKWTEIILSFLRLHPSTSSDSFVDSQGYSISSKEFLPKRHNCHLNYIHWFYLPKISMFSIAISCFTTSNLPWFMDLTLQVPMLYCSLQHRTSLPSSVKSTTVCYFSFGSVSSFYLNLVLHWSPGAYWVPTDLGSLSFSVLSFCLFILHMEFSKYEYWRGLPFLLQWPMFCQTSPQWPVHLGWLYIAWFIVSLN